jgi:hypothetical protein
MVLLVSKGLMIGRSRHEGHESLDIVKRGSMLH